MKKNEIHIHLIKPEQVDLSYIDYLDKFESDRANQFKFSKDRLQYIASHIFLRKTLSSYKELSPKNWSFTHNNYGKPSISNHKYQSIQFNLSYTQGLIACAISKQYIIGVDIEKYQILSDFDNLLAYTLAKREAEDVRLIENVQQKIQRFFTYWTLKEAYIKAKGMGLSIPLQKFTFLYKENRWQIECDPTLYDDANNWKFFSHSMTKYHLSLGVQFTPEQKNHQNIVIQLYSSRTLKHTYHL